MARKLGHLALAAAALAVLPAAPAALAQSEAAESASGQEAGTPGLGAVPSEALIEAWNIDISPDGENLPEGSATVAEGEALFIEQCAVCHGEQGRGGPMDELAGGRDSLASETPLKTVESYWPYATTLYDYIHRAMPFMDPQSLSPDQVYAATAYVLYLGGIIPEDAVMDETTLPQVEMPNRDSFIQTDTITEAPQEACMEDCTPLQIQDAQGTTPEVIIEEQVQ